MTGKLRNPSPRRRHPAVVVRPSKRSKLTPPEPRRMPGVKPSYRLKEKWIPTPLNSGAHAKIPLQAVPPLPNWPRVSLLWTIFKLIVVLLWLNWRKQLTPVEYGLRLRAFFQGLGPFWIKVGQLLSLRRDVFSPEFCREVAQLQYQATGFPADVARRIVESDLGGPIERYFKEFEAEPFAAASIAQVHRAKLRDGTDVVVKIQRPDAPELFRRDLRVCRQLINFMNMFRKYRHLRMGEMLNELEAVLREEVDYRYEAANIRSMRKNLKAHKVYAPRVYGRLCTQRILVMEFIQGVLLSDFIRVASTEPKRAAAWSRVNGTEPKRVAAAIVTSFLRQMFEENLFHGDLHPGNVILLRDNRFALIDFGSVGTQEREFLQTYMASLQAQASKEYHKAVELTLLLCPDLPPTLDVAKLREDMSKVYRAWDAKSRLRGIPYHERSMGAVGQELGNVLMAHKVVSSWQFLRIARTWGTLDGSLGVLMPEADYTGIFQKYFFAAQGRALLSLEAKSVRRNLVFGLFAIKQIAGGLSELATYQSAFLRRQSLSFEATTSKVARTMATVFSMIRMGVIVTVLFFGFDFITEHHDGSLVAKLLGRIAIFESAAAKIPAYEYEFGIAGLLVFWYIYRKLRQIEGGLTQRQGGEN